MAMKIHPVILCGGSGTRLWPLSRDLHPKQLLALTGEDSLLAATARRVHGGAFAPPIVVCNEAHRFMVADQLAAAGVAEATIVVEPIARNTAPAIAAAAALLEAADPDALMLVLPSDHVIGNREAWLAAIGAAAAAAAAGHLVTFGITPTAPETGYGYIRRGAPVEAVEGAYSAERFVEKPDLATALTYLDEGAWSWNSGMFMFPAGLMLRELARFEPEMVEGVRAAVAGATSEGPVVRLSEPAFAAVASISVDYALMERAERVAVVPSSLDWSDVGSWAALWEIAEKDDRENVAVGDVMVEDTTGSYLRSHGPLIATLGLKDVVIVATDDVVLAAARDRSQDVKRFVSRLRSAQRPEAVSHALVHQPWGAARTLDSGPDHLVRRLTVKPGRSLSLTAVEGRSSRWTVVGGAARLARDGCAGLTLTPGGSLECAPGEVLRLDASGAEPCEIIEVQSAASAAGQT